MRNAFVWLAAAALFFTAAPGRAYTKKKPVARGAKRKEVLKSSPKAQAAPSGKEAAKRGGKKAKRERPDPVRGRGEVVMPAAPSTDPDRDRIDKLQEELSSLLTRGPLSRTHVGVEVRRVADGRLLYSQNAGRLFDPASNEKILTTAAALSLLGPTWKYRTVLAGPRPRNDGVVVGDVFLRGSGDPMLSISDLAEIARQVAGQGITRITGSIVVEEAGYQQAGAPVDTSDEEDELGYAPLSLNRNRIMIRVAPGPVGTPPTVSVDPPVFQVGNYATSVARGRGGLRAEIAPSGSGAGIVNVTGRIARAVAFKRRPPKPALFAAAALQRVLEDFGVAVGKPVRAGRLPKTEIVLGSHERPLAEAIRPANIYSNNFVAERIFQTVGAEMYGHPASQEKGQRAIHELMRRYGIKSSDYTAINGSGLAHCNRVTPGALVSLLRKLYYDIEVAPDFMSSLSVGGVSGTTRRRFMGHPTAGLVRAKTGTLRGKSALSGFVGDKEDVVVFSILVDSFGHKRQNQIRTAQAYLVDAMLRYARKGVEPPPGALPPPGIVIPPSEPGAQPPTTFPPDDGEEPDAPSGEEMGADDEPDAKPTARPL